MRDSRLAVEVIWTPILRTDVEVSEAARERVSDPRARHWWDRTRWAQRAFAPLLGLKNGVPAWDVYLLYPAGTRWAGDGPPRPASYMHQLSELPPELALHGGAMRTAVEETLRAATPAAGGTSPARARERAPGCSLDDAALADRAPVIRELASAVRSAKRRPDGLELEYDRTPEMRRKLDAFVKFESACCSHLGFRIEERRRPARLRFIITTADRTSREALWARLASVRSR